MKILVQGMRIFFSTSTIKIALQENQRSPITLYVWPERFAAIAILTTKPKSKNSTQNKS
jgi:hypothetical protein